MSPELSSWLPGLMVLGLGLVLGLWVGLAITRRDAQAKDPDAELDDLDQRKEHLIAQLRDLEVQRDRLDPETYSAQRNDYEERAADTLRARDALVKKHSPRRSGPPVAEGGTVDRPARHLLTFGVAGLLIATVGLYLMASRDQAPGHGDRRAADDSGATRPAPPKDPALDAVRARLAQNPADVGALSDGARILVQATRFEEAVPYIERALQLEPEHPGALVQLAALRLWQGNADAAVTVLDRVVVLHPEELEAWSLRGMIALEQGERATARRCINEYLTRAPDGPQKERVRALLPASD